MPALPATVQIDGPGIGTFTKLFVLDDGREFTCDGRVAIVDGVPVVTDVLVSSWAGVDSTMMRAVRPAELVREVTRIFRSVASSSYDGDGLSAHLSPVEWAAAQEMAGDLGQEPTGGRGRPRLSDEHLRDVAVQYLAAQTEVDEQRAAGTRGTSTISLLAERLERPEKTVEDWIRRAAKAGYLSKAVKGRAGRDAGPRLLGSSSEPQKNQPKKRGSKR